MIRKTFLFTQYKVNRICKNSVTWFWMIFYGICGAPRPGTSDAVIKGILGWISGETNIINEIFVNHNLSFLRSGPDLFVVSTISSLLWEYILRVIICRTFIYFIIHVYNLSRSILSFFGSPRRLQCNLCTTPLRSIDIENWFF